jgi:hypothetical protein
LSFSFASSYRYRTNSLGSDVFIRASILVSRGDDGDACDQTMTARQQSLMLSGPAELSEIRTNQFVAALSTPRVHLRGRPANQIAIGIERTEKALFVVPELRFHPLKRIDGDKEGIFNRGVISPKSYGLPGSVITSAMIRKLQGHGYPSVWIASHGAVHE